MPARASWPGKSLRRRSYEHDSRAAGPGVDLRLSDHVLVSEVDAIEETQGQADPVGAEGLRGTQDGHGHQRAT